MGSHFDGGLKGFKEFFCAPVFFYTYTAFASTWVEGIYVLWKYFFWGGIHELITPNISLVYKTKRGLTGYKFPVKTS